MNATIKRDVPLNTKICVSTEELMQLLSCGRYTAVKIAKDADAGIHYGRTVLWNVQKIQDYINRVSE